MTALRSEHPVVACYDGPDATHAVQLGAALAAALGQPLVVTSAYHYEPAALSARPAPPPEEDRGQAAAEASALRAARVVSDEIELRTRAVPATAVAEALVELAREEDACALVLGRDRYGTTLRSVLEQAPCPIAVSPFDTPPPERESLQSIGVAYDGSPGADAALAAAIGLAEPAGARVRLIAVGLPAEEPAVDATAAASASLDGPPVEVLLCTGAPGAKLVEASDSLDLLVCGSHGRGRLRAAVLGSVSGELVHAARCPVLVVGPRVTRRAEAPLGLTTAAD